MTTGISTKIWNSKNWVVRKITFKGASALSGTLDNTAVVDNGDGTVTIAITGHGFLAGSWIYIQGTTNYDGLHLITAVAANSITITATYVAETPAGTEYYGVGVIPGVAFKLNELRLHLSAAVGATEDLTVTIDSVWGSQFDHVQVTQAMNGLADWDWPDPDKDYFYEAGDLLKIAWANTDGRTWGLEAVLVTME